MGIPLHLDKIIKKAAKVGNKARIRARKAAIEQMKREEGVMPFQKSKAKEDKGEMPYKEEVPEISESGTLTEEQWAAQKPQKKLGESKKDFGKRHRAWINRRPKI